MVDIARDLVVLMVDGKYTPEGLPVVSAGVLEVLTRDIEKRIAEGVPDGLEDHFAYSSFLGTGMFKSNPELSLCLAEWAGRLAGDRETVRKLDLEGNVPSFYFGFLMCYEALAKASETLGLEDSVSGGDGKS